MMLCAMKNQRIILIYCVFISTTIAVWTNCSEDTFNLKTQYRHDKYLYTRYFNILNATNGYLQKYYYGKETTIFYKYV